MKNVCQKISVQVIAILIASIIIAIITKAYRTYMETSTFIGSNEFIFWLIIVSAILIVSLFSVHAYMLSQKAFKAVFEQSTKILTQTEKLLSHTKQIDFIIETLKDLHPRFWFLKGDINRGMAYTFRGTPYTSFMLWLRSAESFNRSGDIDMTRASLKETYDAIKQVANVTIEDLNESNNLLTNIHPVDFRHEINAINDEIKRLTMATT